MILYVLHCGGLVTETISIWVQLQLMSCITQTLIGGCSSNTAHMLGMTMWGAYFVGLQVDTNQAQHPSVVFCYQSARQLLWQPSVSYL